MSSQKIKSFTINLPVDTISFNHITFNQIKIRNIDKLDKDQLQALQALAIIDGNIEYEKPTLLKRPDGSLITEPAENTNVIEIWLNGTTGIYQINKHTDNKTVVVRWSNSHDKGLIMQGLIFLPEDKDLAKKKAKRLTKQIEIQLEIDRLNAEEKDKNLGRGYYLCVNTGRVDYYRRQPYITDQNNVMSQKTAEIILAKYTQDELKQYLGIIF